MLHAEVRVAIERQQMNFDLAVGLNDTDALWDLIRTTFENAFQNAMAVYKEPDELPDYSGHGKPNLITQCDVPRVHVDQATAILFTQKNRLSQISFALPTTSCSRCPPA